MATKNAASETTSPTVSTEIVLKDGTAVQVRQANPAEVGNFLSGGMVEERDDESTTEIVQRMVSQVFAANTAEEIFGASTVIGLKDYLDKPFTVIDADWYKSSFTEGAPMFMVLTAADANGTIVRLSTGAVMPQAMVYRAKVAGVLSDVRVKAERKDRPTQAGFYPINLVLAD